MAQPNQSITFVIGAGASNEVDMPTGHELKTSIARALEFEVDIFRRLAGGDQHIREAMYELAQQPTSKGDINAYFQSALLIRNAMPQAPSIDNFIDSHRSDPKIAECGKLAIASEILKAERASKLFIDPSNTYNKIDFKRIENSWFNSFFQLLTLNTQFEDITQRLSRVKIISFNYDRTLEHYIYHALQNYYGCTSTDAAAALNSLDIFHPYGSVGALPCQKKSTIIVSFGETLSGSSLNSVASTLRTFTESTDTAESQITQIRSAVADSEKLVFVGFAYHELNLELLFGPSTDGPVRHLKQVYGTAKAISESNIESISRELAQLGRFDRAQIILRRDLSALEIFKEYSRSLRF